MMMISEGWSVLWKSTEGLATAAKFSFHAKYKFDIDFMTICDCVKVLFYFHDGSLGQFMDKIDYEDMKYDYEEENASWIKT